jgi:hypothetical protein
MRSTLAAAACVLLACGIARADQVTDDVASGNAVVGVGLICNTREQAELYISLIGAGQDGGPAMRAVNTEMKNPSACGVAAVVFRRGETLDSKTVHGKSMEVVRINVLAGFNGQRWQRASGLVQYAVMEPTGIEI